MLKARKNKLVNDKNMLLLALVFFGLLFITIVFPVSHVADWIGQDKIVTDINTYLSESKQVARYDLYKLSELDAQLSLLQNIEMHAPLLNSEVGIGQLMAPFSNLIMESIDTVLLTISTIEIVKYMINLSEVITPWFFVTLLVAVTLYGVSHAPINGNNRYKTVCDDFVKLAITLFLVFHLCIPYSLHGAALLSQKLIVLPKVENLNTLQNLHESMGATHKKINLSDRAEDSIHTFEKAVLDLPHKVEAISIYYSQHMAMSLFEYIVMPIILFFILFIITLWVIRTAFRAKRLKGDG